VTPASSTRPRPIGLASWLGGGSVAVVTLAVVAMALACGVLLARVVRQQALVRVELAASTGRELLRRLGDDVLTDTQVLAERPTLQRLLREGPATAILPFITRYCESSGNTACVVQGPDNLQYCSAPGLPLEAVMSAQREQGQRFLFAPASGEPPWWGAAVPVSDHGGWRVLVLRQASSSVIDELGRQASASLRLINFAAYHAPPDDPLTALHSAALGSARVTSVRRADRDQYAASIAVNTVTGETIALLDATIPGAEFSAVTRSLDRWLLIIAIAVAVVAGIGGLLYGRWLARPVVALRDVAQRIGRGDLSAAVPQVAPLEVGALARSMEDMRQNLGQLTESLRRREAEAQALLAGIVEGVIAVDGERKIRYANPQAARLVGRPREELLGKFCGDVLLPEPVNGCRPCEQDCPILHARTAGYASAPEKLCRADGSVRSAIITSSAPVDGMQVQILRDETELEAVRRARDSVLGNISHEFRTPLAAQLASIELLRDGINTLPRDSQGELLDNVERGVLRLMRLIDNLLESVRIEAGQLSIRSQPIDIADTVHEAAELVRPLLAQRRLQLASTLEALDRPVAGDAQRLQQVFVNLLSNAIKFAPEGSTIRVGGQNAGPCLELWVDDAGPGVAGEDAAAIFERFQRAAGAEPDAPGLGLGLWIVRSIIERHGGGVRVGRTPDGYTRFTLRLPAALETEA
jgi:signal transduction histidine kinase